MAADALEKLGAKYDRAMVRDAKRLDLLMWIMAVVGSPTRFGPDGETQDEISDTRKLQMIEQLLRRRGIMRDSLGGPLRQHTHGPATPDLVPPVLPPLAGEAGDFEDDGYES